MRQRSSRTGERLTALVDERERALSGFIEAEQDRLARACHELARAFARGGTLIPFGSGPAATDAAHAAVEFMHPVIVGKRALPALAPSSDPTGMSTLERLGRAGDVALVLCHDAPDRQIGALLERASERGLVTFAMTGAGTAPNADYAFAVPSEDPHVVQEVQETAYHVLWELVHVFFDHPGLLEDSCITCGDVAVEALVVELGEGHALIERGGAREQVAVDLVEGVEVGDRLLCHAGVALEKLPPDPAGFLYPFLGSAEQDLDSVLEDVRSSTVRKGQDVAELRGAIDLEAVERCAAEIRARLERGGRLIAFGNGGSSTDAQDAAGDFLAAGWPALALNNDVATVTAVGNDVGFELAFARQLIPLAREQDVALAISTSGSSANVIAGLGEAGRRGMLTCGIAGYDGGRMASLDGLDHLFVAGSDYIPRLQEAHATIYHLLLAAVGAP